MQTDLEFVLQSVFNHVPAGVRTQGDFRGEAYDEFWWRETVDNSGYVIVWLVQDKLFCHHTYHHPENIYT